MEPPRRRAASARMRARRAAAVERVGDHGRRPRRRAGRRRSAARSSARCRGGPRSGRRSRSRTGARGRPEVAIADERPAAPSRPTRRRDKARYPVACGPLVARRALSAGTTDANDIASLCRRVRVGTGEVDGDRPRGHVGLDPARRDRTAPPAHAPRGTDDAREYSGGKPSAGGQSRVACRKRSIEARTSVGRTGLPSEYRSPRRSVKT